MRFDLAVVGGGVVGASVARAARGLSVALIAADRPADRERSQRYDARIYALSPGNVAFLRSIKAWDLIPADRLTPVHSMRVFGDAPDTCIEFDAYRAGASELAWIVEDSALQAALWTAMSAQDGLELIVPGQCDSLEVGGSASLGLSSGRQIEAGLVIGADGADSFVRTAAGIHAAGKLYSQTAVVANFKCAKPHGHTAFQWFQRGAVLALLPLPGDRVSMVWSVSDDESTRLTEMGGEQLADAVTAASAGVLGTLEPESRAQGYSLRTVTASRLVAPHVALVGDAAHVIHPLAGQGLNLGLQDARSLAAVILQREKVRGVGDLRVLRRYERSRSEAILAMRTGVDSLHQLFGSANPVVGRMRNLALNLTNRMPVIKNLLLRHAAR